MEKNKRSAQLLLTGSLVFLLLLPSLLHAHDLVWPGEKLKVLYPDAVSFEQKNLYVSDEQRAHIEKLLGSRLPEEDLKPSIYLAVVKTDPDERPRKAAALMFVDAHGEAGKIEMGVVVSVKGELLRVIVFENNEIAEVSQQAFLRQFEGKRASDAFAVGKDIAAPAGAAKAAQAIASGAKRGITIINEMFRKR